MKLLLTAFLCSIISATALGQVEFGIFAGPQATTAGYTANGVVQDNKFKVGFNLGASMKVPFEGNLYFAPAAYYSLKGYKVTFNRFIDPPGPQALNNNTNIHTFELAPMLQYDFGTMQDHFFIKGGPSLDFQLFGNEKFDTANGNVSRKMKYSYADYGRFGANAIIHLGYERGNGLFITGFYSHGLTSICNADFGPKIRHKVFGITIGKFINRNKVVIDTRNKE